MFRATVCLSSGETTIFMRHLVLVILYGRPSDMQGRIKKIGMFYLNFPGSGEAIRDLSQKFDVARVCINTF